ncbi:type III secretion system YopN/LcrE/InvE/MxiC family regulator [Pseudomonas sp. JAI115]|uniref:TyeA family type III secretion system gatekeeper subunit n=1 Tax=Pseudomonas sp. JAI115 TaxID=2723061 RepID=UPI00160DE981|nr:TyeA family type III secretion system gatekeeper subunit [Pseudomonas sp. JAI115]MBB6155188.1 type III secretion system YopN/LcrE/InvE/MxiC family regulator [Pseudomonas sp. JAI115]
MMTKTDPLNPKPITTLQPPLPTPLKGATQIFPARSVFELARSELSGQTLERGAEALAETQENLGFTLGARRGAGRIGLEGRIERPRTRPLLQQLVRSLPATARIDEARRHLSALPEVTEIVETLEREGHDAGEAALLLASLLEEEPAASPRRAQLEKALASVTAKNDWSLQLFARLELGPGSQHSFQQLKQLYQRATDSRPRLLQWFEAFRRLQDRDRKLKALIRTLAFELSAEGPATGSQLGAVISDLKRILLFWGMEDHCQRAARSLNIEELSADTLAQTLLEVIEQPWMQAEWILEQARQQVPDATRHYAYVQQLLELVKLMTEECFEDSEQRSALLETLYEAREQLADQGL